MASSFAAIEVNNIRKEFDDMVAVNDISFKIEEGTFFSLLGPSGCGKTTTLRMISGLETPTQGTVSLFGEDVTDVPPQERKTNLVFQNLALFPHMTVEQNLKFGLQHEDLTTDERLERIDNILNIVDMSGFEDRNVTQLSGGQQQRVALARALVKQPSVLLLDEPLSSLDRKLRQHMQFELKELQEELKTTFFYVTHDQEVAMTMSDRMAVMRDGEIVQEGTPDEIYENPTNAFVADFIGDANWIEGSLSSSGTGTFFISDEIEVPVNTPAEGGQFTAKNTSNKVQLVLRPENIDIGEGALNHEFTFEGVVIDRIHQGHTINFIVELSSGKEIEIRQKDYSIAQGNSVYIGFNSDDYALVTE